MLNKKRIPRNLTDDEVRRLLSLTPDSITKETMMKYFANFDGEEAMFLFNDKFVLPKRVINEYAKEEIQKEDIHTTVGRYIFNLFLIFSNPEFLKKLGYINRLVDNGGIGDISNAISSLIIDKKITVKEYYDYMNRLEWFGFANSAFTTPSINYDIVKPLPSVMKRKEELIKENKEKLEAGDVTTSALIEKELVELSAKELKDNSAFDLYKSGAKVNLGNQYKNMNIMNGALLDNTTGNYRIVTNNFVNGLSKEDISANGDSLVSGVYSRACGTQKGGYEGKKITSAFQSVILDSAGTDCGSNHYLKILLTKDNKKFFNYRYIKKGNSLVLLNDDNIDSYLNQYIELRSPMYCKGKKICNKCAGESYYLLGIKNIGLTATKVSSTALNASLKQFHDQSIKLTSFEFEEYID